MDTLYWLGEYGKTFCCYIFFMFIWPSVVFSRHLKNKDKVYRFGFCVSVQVVLANSVVLGLGLLHILNQWIVFLIFHGIFLWNLAKRIKIPYCAGIFEEFYHLVMGTCGLKLFIYRRVKKVADWIKKLLLRFWAVIRPHFLEYLLLSAVLIYGMIYFSYGTFQDYNYAFGDMYVHHQWINGLIEGTIFYNGVYPEGMHCFIYCLNVLFGIKLYNCILFLAGVHVIVFLVSVYVFLREIFQWKYTPIFVLLLFLILDLMCIQEVYSMSRLQWTIPQEFGLYTQFLCALFLIRYLKSSHTAVNCRRLKKFYWNENLLLFMLTLAASIVIHFYSTIMAFLLCVSFAVFWVGRVLKKERFFPLLAAAVCGFMIAVLPMAGALASGIPFQGSIGWAMSVINNEDEIKEAQKKEEAGKLVLEEESGEMLQKESDGILLEGEGNGTMLPEEGTSDWQDGRTFAEKLEYVCSVLYWQGYVTLYLHERADWIVGFTVFAVVLWLVYRVIRGIYRLWTKKKSGEAFFDGYIPIISSSLLFMIVYVSPGLGLPQLIADSRICTTEQLLLLSIMMMPVDMVFTLLGRVCADSILQGLSAVTAAGIFWGTVASGSYHGYLYCELSRYNASIKVADSIINNFPKYAYTIVSTTDELYQVIQYGRHEEWLTFLQSMDEEGYKLPTEYVFLFVEKKPIEYGQSHYFSGPAWLAGEKYTDLYADFASRCPEINASAISAEESQKELLLYHRPSLSYTKLESRTIVESKAYLWCQNFAKLHAFEVETYYEDESFVCYYFRQNPYALYDLAIDGWDRTDGITW